MIEKIEVLVLSTKYISKDETELLNSHEFHTLVAGYEEGWFVYVGGRGDWLPKTLGLCQCFQEAWHHGCEWLRLDADGPDDQDHLHSWDW